LFVGGFIFSLLFSFHSFFPLLIGPVSPFIHEILGPFFLCSLQGFLFFLNLCFFLLMDPHCIGSR
jgi:hypothetical protein